MKRALIPLLFGGKKRGVQYLLRDEFTTDEAAPLTSPRTCEPGPGTLTIIDTANKLSISDGNLAFSGYISTSDPSVYGGLQAASIGLAIFCGCSSGAAANYIMCGWSKDKSGMGSNSVKYQPHISTAVVGVVAEAGFAPNKEHSFAAIMRGTAGAWLLSKVNGGQWVLHYVDEHDYSDNLYPGLSSVNIVDATGKFNRMCVLNLPAPFDSVNGLATAVVASSGANGTSTMDADALVEFTWTAATGATLNFMFRRTDDDNCWIVRCDQANSRMYLYEKNLGTETERGATGGVAQTFINGVAYRIWIKSNGNMIEVGITRGAVKLSYATATFNKTATDIKHDLAVTNLISWPRLITGDALAVINKYFP